MRVKARCCDSGIEQELALYVSADAKRCDWLIPVYHRASDAGPISLVQHLRAPLRERLGDFVR